MERVSVVCLRNQLFDLLQEYGDFEDPTAFELLHALLKKNWPSFF